MKTAKGASVPVDGGIRFNPLERRLNMENTIQQKNKDLVLEAFDTLFNKRDYARAESFRIVALAQGSLVESELCNGNGGIGSDSSEHRLFALLLLVDRLVSSGMRGLC